MREHQNVEWKPSWRDEWLKWICAFANAEGGVLVIGRDDDGNPLGVPNARRLLEEIPNKVRDLLGIMVDVNLVEEAGRELIEIEVDAHPHPVSYKGEYYYRSGSTTQPLKGAALNHFLLRKVGRHWDGVSLPGVTVTDLDKSSIDRFRKRAVRSKRLGPEVSEEHDAALIERLRLVEGGMLKRAAVLLFHPDPERFITGAFIKIGFFRSDADLLYHDEVHGDLFAQVDGTMNLLLTKYLKAMISYEGLQRVETYPVPEEALREALLNAVAHKDYADGAPIQISVYDDRIMIWNSAHLPEGWGVEQLIAKHSSRPFNPDIANAFFRCGLIEAWGRGIEKMRSACRAHGIPKPVFRFDGGGLWTMFEFAKAVEEGTTRKTTRKTTQKTTQRILSILKAHPTASRKEIAVRLGDITEDGVKYHLDKMKKDGLIRRVGPPKGGHWEVLEEERS